MALRPVVAVAGQQPDALAIAVDDQAVAVVLDLMDPLRPVGNRGRTGGNTEFEYIFKHDD